ncbi:hypothetical protein FEZ61_10120 [Pseudomonas sp. MS15a(2019)]|nr:hypothetical protein [Pseudomonas sp. MS15a(2019)]NRH42251.1 hypothetical protein [Pseudomonas sp. MS15a(2019)]
MAGYAARPASEPKPRVVRVEVPVQIPCRVKEPAEGLRKKDSLEVKVRALLEERRQRIGYEQALVATVVTCQ